jgi:hypothetical protein
MVQVYLDAAALTRPGRAAYPGAEVLAVGEGSMR